MIIDFHTHIVSPAIREKRDVYVDRDPYFRMLYSGKDRLATAEDLIASMDEAGVDVSVALNLPWQDLDLLRESNDYILESMARYPARIVGFGVLPPGEGGQRELERLVQGGIKGLGELGPGPGFGPEDLKGLAPLVRKHSLPLLSHTSEPVGHSYAGKGTVTPGVIYPFIEALPDVTFVLAHWGGGLPFYALMPEVADALKNTYVDTAATRLLYRPAIYSAVGQLIGWDRILFGTDFPLLSQARCVEEVRALPLGQEKKRAILGGNARRLLKL